MGLSSNYTCVHARRKKMHLRSALMTVLVGIAYQSVQFYGLVGRSPVLVLARILPNPEMEVVFELLRGLHEQKCCHDTYHVRMHAPMHNDERGYAKEKLTSEPGSL